jgi:hypothetical protein
MSRLGRVLTVTVGVYAAAVLVPLAALLADWFGATLPALTTLGGGGAVAAAVGIAVAASVPDLPRAVASTPNWLAVVLSPLGYLAVLSTLPPGSPLEPLVFVGVAAAALGVVVTALGAVIVNHERLADATEYAVFETGDGNDGGPFRAHRQLSILAAVGVSVIALVTIIVLRDGEMPLEIVSMLGGLSSLVALVDADDREVGITDEGVRTNQWLHSTERLSGYRFSPDELVIERDGLWSDLTFERDEIDDEERVGEALGRILPRLDS